MSQYTKTITTIGNTQVQPARIPETAASLTVPAPPAGRRDPRR